KRKVIPGDVLELEVTLVKRKGPIGVGEAVARVNGVVVTTAELTFAVRKAPVDA
ncbi:MAG: 3-hydroxyacyl-ACP dehydratase FabZ, partial [Culicoidibacterales bacterium]